MELLELGFILHFACIGFDLLDPFDGVLLSLDHFRLWLFLFLKQATARGIDLDSHEIVALVSHGCLCDFMGPLCCGVLRSGSRLVLWGGNRMQAFSG